ncbi:class I SAM-dependent methyltransferase [Mucilaginibacter sp. HMF5004]|uniref:class I SAM-dependent methyltransferase n=1 Tax=Mucilaginibacter rivuli TaxID=2857527 RepID=UPI001C5CDAF1|nr:class I SAM-dependent methyltransferase [Mucilaginibacter rivuli]MBW4890202.1 class I SAM-dependent methyltransferase [Mucilaginibacter rivuli]
MLQTQDAYNDWAKTYDTVINKTRDLEAVALKNILGDATYQSILELGCGTGKNTAYLAGKCEQLIAADFSEEMMVVAQEKINSVKVTFKQADITQPWRFGKADLITCSLILEHIENLDHIFAQATKTLNPGGQFYICELHPYKQLEGSRAKFEKDGELHQLAYFVHHISDFTTAAQQYGFICDDLQEWFDDDDRSNTPRLISFLFGKV